MTYWILPSNEERFKLNDLLKETHLVDWRQHNYFNIGDIVFMYNSRPSHRILYKMIVERTDVPCSEYLNDKKFWADIKHLEEGFEQKKFARLRFLKSAPKLAKLSLDDLHRHGLKGTIQSPRRIYENIERELLDYIIGEFESFYIADNSFDAITDTNNQLYEGAKTTVTVNKYERSQEARKKCLKANGYICSVCGMNFESLYGSIGKDFIHVHHVVPISEIGEEYVIDPVHDLVPVCPNCHAMLHKGIDGRVLTVDELRKMIKK